MSEDVYKRRTCADGEMIFDEGDRAAEAYLIVSGNVRLITEKNGELNEIDEIGPGKIFGEMGVISDMNRMASAVAVGDVVLTCCHRQERNRKIEVLDEERRIAMRFLIVYCQEFLPYELMDHRPNDEETRRRDGIAYYLIRDAHKPGELDRLDPFLRGLYMVLISYAERRLPPDFEP